MKNLPDVGDNHEKILSTIRGIKVELLNASEKLECAGLENEVVRKLSGSLHLLFDQLNTLESESLYLQEINTCRHIMLTDYLAHIRKLEQELLELKS